MATIREVAKRAGVSAATVSRVLSGDPGFSVREETRRKINDAVAQLQYEIPVRQQNQFRFGCVLSDTTDKYSDPFFVDILVAMEEACKSRNATIAVVKSFRELDNPQILQEIICSGLDGVFLMEHVSPEAMTALETHIPHIIFIDKDEPEYDFDNVGFDHTTANWQVMNALLDRGYKRIALISGSSPAMPLPETIRMVIYREMLRRAGFEYDETDEGIVIRKYTGMDADPRIRSEYGGRPVVEIGNEAFSGCTRLKSFEIPEGVRRIGQSAFSKCPCLTSIVIPDSVTEIGERAFESCDGLTSVVIGNGVTEITECTFLRCRSLSSVKIRGHVKEIKEYAFCRCESLRTIDIPEGLTRIGMDAFSGSGLVSITLPEGLTRIGKNAFRECYKLTTAVLPDTVTIIGNNAFESCSRLTSVNIPRNLPVIGHATFNLCRSLAAVSIPDGVTEIRTAAFTGCAMTSVVIPDSVATIGDDAFSVCKDLSMVMIGKGVRSIGSSAFFSCCSLAEIIIPDNVAEIGKGAFADCYDLVAAKIGKGVKFIGKNAFENCDRLTVYCPRGSYAVEYCMDNDLSFTTRGVI